MTKEERKIKQLTEKLLNLGPMLPGSMSQQWNVCGTPGCRCKDPKHPVKHGPYYQVNFTIRGKHSSLFVKKEDAAEARRRMRRYKTFKKLVTELTWAYVDLIRTQGFTPTR